MPLTPPWLERFLALLIYAFTFRHRCLWFVTASPAARWVFSHDNGIPLGGIMDLLKCVSQNSDARPVRCLSPFRRATSERAAILTIFAAAVWACEGGGSGVDPAS